MSSEDFKKRVGLAIGTANPNNEDIQNTATGLGGLILRGDLYNKALAGANNNSFQDFDSFVVTDPNLVDPGIDVSGLRTTTDVSPYLLGGIPDYEGIRYEAYNPNRLTDLMRLYSSGLPTLDTPQAAAPDFTGGEMIDTGDGGQATTIQPIDTGGNTDFEQNLIDEGIGVQLEPGAPVVAPGENPVTQQEMDDFNYPGLTQDNTADEIMNDFNYQSLKEDLSGGNLVDEVALTGGQTNLLDSIGTSISNTVGTIYDSVNKVVDIAGQKINLGSAAAKAIINKLAGGPISLVIDALKMIPKSDSQLQYQGFNEEQQSAIDSAYGLGGVMEGYNAVSQFGKGPLETIQKRIDDRYQNVSDPANDRIIKELETLRDELGGIEAVNATITGAPQEDIGAVDSIFDITNETGIQAADDDSGSEMLDTPTDIVDVQAVKDAIKKAEESTITNNITSNQIDEFNIDPVDDISLIDAAADYQIQPSNVYQGGGSDSSTVDSSGNVTDSSGQSQGNINDEFSQPKSTFEDQSYSGGGGGGGNGGGKSIVCTAMYQTTGLEDWSKAMKIWYIYQKKYLTIQHQEGYHKLFKPFVKGMHKNKIIRAIGAHVAKHRTQELKHIMFNSKSDTLGKIYNNILEPICYLAGKIKSIFKK